MPTIDELRAREAKRLQQVYWFARGRRRHITMSQRAMSPPDFANLELWLDFSDLTTLFQDTTADTPVAADNDAIALARDKSGKGNHATQGTAGNQGFWDASQQNSRGVVYFNDDTGTDHMDLALAINLTGGLEIFIVERPDAMSTTRHHMGQDSTNNNFVRHQDANTYHFNAAGNSINIAHNLAFVTTGFQITNISRSAANLVTVYKDALEGASPTSRGGTLIIDTLAQKNAERQYDGRMGEVIIYSGSLTDAERVQFINDYLNDRWQIWTTYNAKALQRTSDIVAYYPLDETSGATADNAEGTAAKDATYTGPTVNSITSINGQPCPLFDGVNDYIDCYSATFDTDFDPTSALIGFWVKPGSGWGTSDTETLFRFAADGSNEIYIQKTGANQITYYYEAGSTILSQTQSIIHPDWIYLAISIDATADEVKCYYNDTLIATLTGLGTWAGALSATDTVIGAHDTAVTTPFYGYICDFFVGDVARTDYEIAHLARSES